MAARNACAKTRDRVGAMTQWICETVPTCRCSGSPFDCDCALMTYDAHAFCEDCFATMQLIDADTGEPVENREVAR